MKGLPETTDQRPRIAPLFEAVPAAVRSENVPAKVITRDMTKKDHGAFDEQAYLGRYPDVAQAVARGHFASGWSHYSTCGFLEGRIGTQIVAPQTIEIPAEAKIFSISNPGFTVTPPRIYNRDLMPLDIQNMYSVLWNQKREESSIDCFALDNVIVAGEGLVFDSEGRLYAQTMHQSTAHEVEQASVLVDQYLKELDRRPILGTTVLCEKAGLKNYGHWLVEMLPIIYLHRKHFEDDWHIRLPVADNNASMTRVIGDSTCLLHVDPTRVRWGMPSVPQRYERLILTTGLTRHGSFYSPHAKTTLECLATDIEPSPSQRVWVSRLHTPRRLSEEEVLCRELTERGWTIADTSAMTFMEQIRLFKGADVIAGVNGAGLTNLAFAGVSTKIISFVPCQMPDIFFWMLSQFKGQDFTEVRCPQEYAGREDFNWQCRLTLDSVTALRYIDTALETS